MAPPRNGWGFFLLISAPGAANFSMATGLCYRCAYDFCPFPMTLLVVVAALLLDLYVIVALRGKFDALLQRYAEFVRHALDAGEHRVVVFAWLAVVVPIMVVSIAVYGLLYSISPALAWILNVAVLFALLHLKRTLDHLNAMSAALRHEDFAAAHTLLGAWRGIAVQGLDSGTLARLTIERALIDIHRHLLAPVFWFVVLPGPSGPLLYWAAALLADYWSEIKRDTSPALSAFARKVFYWIDWLPQRLTAISFAVAGNFEDAVYCWRSQAREWPDDASGVLLASGAGAMGVKLGDPISSEQGVEFRPEIGSGETAHADHLRSTEGLIWRTVVVWLGVLALFTVAGWVGR